MARSVRRRLIRPLYLAVLAFVATACATNAPQDTLTPEGPIARQQDQLFKPVFWIAAAIFFIVEGLILVAIIKFRDRPGREEPAQVHGNSKLEFTWTLIPALILLGVAIPTVATIFAVSASKTPDSVNVKVIGKQWWWEYQYQDLNIVTANELVIPINRRIYLELESADVIHSFWVPKLAGKQDVVPGRTNTLTLEAEQPGKTYLGQCAEFCAISHANMRLRVITKTQAEFDRWVEEQKRPAAEPTTAEAQRGRDLFMANACIQCHALDPKFAGGVGPNLAHFASRETFGAAVFPNEDPDLFEWVKHARIMKAGVVMPNFDRPLPEGLDPGKVSNFKQLTDDEIRAIVAFLRSLV